MKPIFIELKKTQIISDVVARMNVLARTLETDEALSRLAGYIATPDNNDTTPIVARAMTEGFDKVKMICQRFLQYGRYSDDNRLEDINGSDSFVIEKHVPQTHMQFISYNFLAGRTYEIDITCDARKPADIRINALDMTTLCNEHMMPGQKKTILFKALCDYGTVSVVFTTHSDDTEDEAESYVCQEQLIISIHTDSDISLQLSLAMPDSFNVGMTSAIKSAAHHIIVANILVEFLRDQYEKAAVNYMADIEEQERILLSALNATIPFERISHDWI